MDIGYTFQQDAIDNYFIFTQRSIHTCVFSSQFFGTVCGIEQFECETKKSNINHTSSE